MPFSAPALYKNILCPKDPDFHTPLALKTAKRQHLPAPEEYKISLPKSQTLAFYKLQRFSATRDENTSDHPHPPIFVKKMPPKYAIQWGSVWHKSRLKSRDFYRRYGIRTPKARHTGPPILCRMSRFYWGWGWSSWWAVRARKKIFSSPPPLPTDLPRRPSASRASSSEPPPPPPSIFS